jgi:hypothetical protein
MGIVKGQAVERAEGECIGVRVGNGNDGEQAMEGMWNGGE